MILAWLSPFVHLYGQPNQIQLLNKHNILDDIFLSSYVVINTADLVNQNCTGILLFDLEINFKWPWDITF